MQRDRFFRSLIVTTVVAVAVTSASATAPWPGLRGPNADGSAAEGARLPEDATGLEIGWQRALGSGYSVPVVGDGLVYAMFAEGDGDWIAAFDLASGEERWRHRIADMYAGHDGSHDGPISTPALAGGRVFGLGPRGQLFALDAATGDTVWSKNIEEAHEAKKPFYGFSTSPAVVDDTLVVEIGAGEGKAVAGFDVADGTLRWSLGDDEIHYHSPVVTTLGGRRLVLAAGSSHLHGIDPASGEALFSWAHEGDPRAMGGATIVPVPAGDDRVFLMSKIDASTMLRIRPDADGTWAVEELWSNNAIKQSYVVPAYHDGHLYGMNNRIFTCVDAATGEIRWRSREPGDGFPTVVGDHLVIMTKPGSLHVVAADPEEYREVARLDLFAEAGEQSWSEVAFAGGSLYARSMGSLARIDVASGAAGDEGPDWIANTAFGAFLADVEAADDKAATVDAFLAAQESFPIVEPSGAVHFVYRGEAQDVGIVGDMIGYRREDPMTRVPGTDLFYWSTLLEPDAAVSYGFIPDYGEVVADPRNDEAASGLFGDVSWLAMPAWDAGDFLGEATAERRGTLETVTWDSAILEGQTRTAKVYLPAGLDRGSDRRYPVVYVHDGKAALEEGSLTNALDNLIGARVEPLIAVFVLGDEENARRELSSPQYGEMIVQELMPKIDAEFPVRTDVHGRASVGAGSAANAAMALAFTHPDLFGRTGGMSPILMTGDEADPFLQPAVGRPMVVYLDWGTYHLRSPHEAWDMGRGARELHAKLREYGWRPTGGEGPFGVGWRAWSSKVDDLLVALFPNQD